MNTETSYQADMDIKQLPIFFAHIEKEITQAKHELRRVFHGRGRTWQGLEQLTADWLGTGLIVSLFKPVDDGFLQALKTGLANFFADTAITIQGIGLQHRYHYGAPFEIIAGQLDNRLVGIENGLKYQLEIGKNQNMGLFLDMRLGREWVKAQSQGKRVLNLFAYTCGFSVAAIEGGASHVLNVDMAKGALSRGRDNHRLNEHDLSKVQFLGYDIFRSWGKITKYGPYDVIIIDPPSFQKGSFALTSDYKKILRRLPSLLNENAQVLACVNSPAVSADFLIEEMKQHAPELEFVERLANPSEFADVDPQASLKALVFIPKQAEAPEDQEEKMIM